MTNNTGSGIEIPDLPLYTHNMQVLFEYQKVELLQHQYIDIKQHTNHSAASLHFTAMGCTMTFIMESTDKNGEFISQYQNFP